ncbi:MAG TPA: hypothetical protein VF493_02535 [Terriglobales bacterium]
MGTVLVPLVVVPGLVVVVVVPVTVVLVAPAGTLLVPPAGTLVVPPAGAELFVVPALEDPVVETPLLRLMPGLSTALGLLEPGVTEEPALLVLLVPVDPAMPVPLAPALVEGTEEVEGTDEVPCTAVDVPVAVWPLAEVPVLLVLGPWIPTLVVVFAAPGLTVLVPVVVVDVLPGEVAPVVPELLVLGPVDDGPGEAILVPTLVPGDVLVCAEATPKASKNTEGAIHSFCISAPY